VPPQDSVPDSDESDLDPSEHEGGAEDPPGSVNTDMAGIQEGVGERVFGASKCRILLSQKSGGTAVICGHAAVDCSQATHRAKRVDPSNRASPGHYIGIYNANKMVVDGLRDTYVSYEEKQQTSDANLEQMRTRISSSAQKQEAETLYRPKTPTQLTFNLDETPNAAAVLRRDSIAEWGDACPQTRHTHLPSKKSLMLPEAAPPGVVSEILALTNILGSKLDTMADKQADSNQQLINILLDVVKSGQVAAAPAIVPSSAKKYYAVSVGRQLGGFTRWKDVKLSVNGFAGAKLKRFRTSAAAQEWFDEQQALLKLDSEQEYNSDATYTEPVDEKLKGKLGAGPVQPQTTPLGIRDIVNARVVGPDTSAGKSGEIFGTSVKVEPRVLELLCPKGMTSEARGQIIETCPDVLSLPGKTSAGYSGGDSSFVWDQFAGAIFYLADIGSAQRGRFMRDTQWQAWSKNLLV
jgi:hypothetical protein